MKTYRVTISYEVASDNTDAVWEGADNLARTLSEEYSGFFEVFCVMELSEIESIW